MTETLHRVTPSVPAPRTESTPPPADSVAEDWTRLTPERRRISELEQLRTDLAAGR